MTVSEELRAAALAIAINRVANEPLPQHTKDVLITNYAREYEKFIKTGEWD